MFLKKGSTDSVHLRLWSTSLKQAKSSFERSISIGSLFEDAEFLFMSDDKNLIMFSLSIF